MSGGDDDAAELDMYLAWDLTLLLTVSPWHLTSLVDSAVVVDFWITPVDGEAA